MCGIVAAVTTRDDIVSEVLTGLKTLEYRGYDSAGVAVPDQNQIHLRRRMGKISALEQELKDHALPKASSAVAHTRWATHGAPSDRNAHPHMDDAKEIVLVHNGIIENYAELRARLQADGHEFSSDTDTEVLVNLIAFHRRKDSIDLHQAVQLALKEVHGAYAIVVLSPLEPDTLIVARVDSPLVVGLSENGQFAASDMPALLHLTREFLILENGESAVLRPDVVTLFDADGNPTQRESFFCEWTPEQAEKGGYPHFMLKEIEEQPDVLARTAFDRFHDETGDVIFEPAFAFSEDDLIGLERIRFMAMGTSFHSALLGQQMMAELAAVPGTTLNASEFLYSPKLDEANTLTVILSQSGETADSLRAMREVQSRGGRILGICNVQGSTLAREADGLVLTHCGPEVGVASTKAFFGQLTALYLLAIHIGRARGHLSSEQGRDLLHDLRALRPKLDGLFNAETQACVKAAADYLAGVSSCLFLGRGFQFPIALEGALKLKEISYIHAEGYPAGEMKHGPIALIAEDFPVIAIATPGRTYQKMISNMEEVRARKGKVIAVGVHGDTQVQAQADFFLPVPDVPELLAPMVNVIPLQQLSYQVALKLGRDIDQPRNLAKSVTVE
jgi:glucosamine--fructose-6-phosphate aminotransferase (isomerizing)